MSKPRVTHPLDPDLGHDCRGMHLESYSIREVRLPDDYMTDAETGFAVEITGTNLRSVAQPLVVSVGDAFVRWTRIAPDERSVEGILLEEPREGDAVEVRLGAQEHVRHPVPVDPGLIERIPRE